jgi:hypothetical protein
MDFKRLADRAKTIFEKRGGSAAAKEDLAELKDIAGRDESLGERAKEAAAALKDPGAPGAASSPGGPAGRPPTAPGTGGPAPSTTPTEPTTADVPPPSDAPPTEQQ